MWETGRLEKTTGVIGKAAAGASQRECQEGAPQLWLTLVLQEVTVL